MNLIESYTYITYSLKRMIGVSIESTEISDRSKINSYGVDVIGVTPSIFEATIDNFLDVQY